MDRSYREREKRRGEKREREGARKGGMDGGREALGGREVSAWTGLDYRTCKNFSATAVMARHAPRSLHEFLHWAVGCVCAKRVPCYASISGFAVAASPVYLLYID